MEFSMAWVAVVLAFVAGIYIGNRRKQLDENEGEALVRLALHSRFRATGFHLLNNVTLPCGDGTTQIDHILVSTRGVFVIETKNYSGWIYGEERSANWTQIVYKKKSRFQNPIRQNYKHLKAVQALLDFLPKEAVFSAVVFVGSAEFKTAKPKHVFNLEQLIACINAKPDGVLSENRVAFSVGRLECTRYQLSGQTDFAHQQYLLKKFGELPQRQ